MSPPTAPSRPDTPHLTADDLAALRAALLARLDTHRSQVADQQAAIDELGEDGDADALVERSVVGTASVLTAETIADLEHALRRIDDGTYGTRERCGGVVARERLEAIPETRHCVRCTGAAPGLLR